MNAEEFDGLLVGYSRIKKERVDPRLAFYTKRVENKRRMAQWTKAAVLLLSLAIPIVVALDVPAWPLPKDLVVSLMSLAIALASGLEGLHQWQRTWREYSSRIVQIETLIGRWDLAVMGARSLADSNAAEAALRKATEDLLLSVEQAVLTEMDTFFSERSRADQGVRG
jgi:hypothetical protein